MQRAVHGERSNKRNSFKCIADKSECTPAVSDRKATQERSTVDQNNDIVVSRVTFDIVDISTSTSVFRDGRISTHADPTSTRRTISRTAHLQRGVWPARSLNYK